MIGNAVVQATLIAPPNTLNVPLPKNVVRTLQRNGVYIRTNVSTLMIFVATQMKQYVKSMDSPHAGQILTAVSMENSGAPLPLMKMEALEIADLTQINVAMKLTDSLGVLERPPASLLVNHQKENAVLKDISGVALH